MSRVVSCDSISCLSSSPGMILLVFVVVDETDVTRVLLVEEVLSEETVIVATFAGEDVEGNANEEVEVDADDKGVREEEDEAGREEEPGDVVSWESIWIESSISVETEQREEQPRRRRKRD